MSRCAHGHPETGRSCAFKMWMQQVVLAMETGYGLHPDDLPDCAYAEWYGEGMEPEEAAREAIALCAGEA